MTTLGFFVDWNGKARPINKPGPGMSCGPLIPSVSDGVPYHAVDVLNSDGEVIHQAVYYPTLQSIRDLGLDIEMASKLLDTVFVVENGQVVDRALYELLHLAKTSNASTVGITDEAREALEVRWTQEILDSTEAAVYANLEDALADLAEAEGA